MIAKILIPAVLSLSLLMAALPVHAAEGRRVISLDGNWAVAEGTMDTPPAQYGHQVPVPGLLDMATPPFESAGVAVAAEDRHRSLSYPADPLREAFWYQRQFTLDGPVPPVALLKVNKAKYGTKVWVNGQLAGEHWPCFTPGYFDLTPYLKGNGQPEELVIRICASMAPLPRSLMNGWDYEKSRYIPGIYDSVELILSGTPRMVSVQAAPLIEKQAVRVQAIVRNDGGNRADFVMNHTVREATGGGIAGQVTHGVLTLEPGEEKSFDVEIPILNHHLWTPEDPFLYTIEVTTADAKSQTVFDTLKTRFGMRDFRLDPASGHAVLNGRPYFLRGSNVCIFRFFEDSERGDLPWNEAWVRQLMRRFKEMHWNSLRYCIGWPPELWYRIADEEGMLIQDEAPIWFNSGAGKLPEAITAEALAIEFSEWLRERWNHPCVVIWDSQNETPNSPATGEAIRLVRDMDLSGRPWDNGWSEPQAPGDSFECHPYRFIVPTFEMSAFRTLSPIPDNNPVQRSGNNPYLINEYGWLWINRDGSLPTLTVGVYNHHLGENATVAQRRHFQARSLAAMTEFWRAHRVCAGVLHFCGLGYSRPDGQTSDNFIDIQNLTFEPEFFQYVRDAFAPVGIMLDLWEETLATNENRTLRTVVINDTARDWQGAVSLRLNHDGNAILEQRQPLTVTALGVTTATFTLTLPDQPGEYQFEAALEQDGTPPVRSLRDVRLEDHPSATGKAALK